MSSNLPRRPCLIESDVSCKFAARPNGLLNKTQLRCRTLSTAHSRAIRYRTQGAPGVLCVIYKRIAQVSTPTSTFLPYSWAQTIFCRNERWIERSQRVLSPPPRSISLPCRNLHILCIVFDLHPPPKGHIISHISIAHNGGRKVYEAFMSYPLGADAHMEAYLITNARV